MRKAIMQELLAEYEAQRQRNQQTELSRRAEAVAAAVTSHIRKEH